MTLRKISLKPEVRTSVNKLQTACHNTAHIHETWAPELNNIRCLKTDPNKSKHVQKGTPKSVQENDVILRVAPPEAPLLAETASGH